jgi:hypothetical protein
MACPRIGKIRTLDGGIAVFTKNGPRPETCEDCDWQKVYASDIKSDDPELSVLAYCEYPASEKKRIGWPRTHNFPEWCPAGWGKEERSVA